MIIRPLRTLVLVGAMMGAVSVPALAQIGGAGAAGGGGPTAGTIGGGAPTAGMAGAGMSGPAMGAAGMSNPGMASPGMTNPGMANPALGGASPGVGTAPGTGMSQPITGVPTANPPVAVAPRGRPRRD